MKKIWLSIALLCLFSITIFAISFKVRRDPVYSERDTFFDQLSLNAGGIESITDIFCYTYKDEGNEYHYMLMPSSSDMDNCVVKFLYADHISIAVSPGKFEKYKNGSVIKGLEAGGRYELRFEDAGNNILHEGILSIICADELPAVFIETASGSMDDINADKEHRESGSVLITDENGKIDFSGKLEYIKGHGNTSWEMVKKAYQLKFKTEKEILGLGASKKWILSANYDYASEEKNALVYELAHYAGLAGTPSFRFTELYFNGQYQGLYLIGGKIESGRDRLDIADLEEMNKRINDDPVDEDHETYLEPGKYLGYDLGGDPADITGGYILERDYSMMAKLLDHPSRFTTARGDTYGIKAPEIATQREAAYISSRFQELEDRIYNGETIDDIADQDSFADKYLLEELVKNSAAGSTSTYFYKDSDATDGRIYAGPAWDYDKALGATRQNLADDPSTFNFCTIHPDTSYLFYELYSQNTGFRELVAKKYRETFRLFLAEAIKDGGIIDSITAEYSRDNGMDAIKWSKPQTDYIVHAQWLKDFISERLKAADRVFLYGEKINIVEYTDEYDSLHIIGVIDGECLGKLPYEADWYDSLTGEEVALSTPIDRDMVLKEH